MPRLQWYFDGDSFGDGAGGDKFLIDITERLSAFYGRLVRQSAVVNVRSVSMRIVNPNTLVQDQAMSLSGKLVYYHPTLYRKLAWHSAFQTWLLNRKALGLKSRNADFRVGFADDYHAHGAGGSAGVLYQAWIRDEEEPLQLTSGTDTSSIFGVWTSNFEQVQPDSSNASFGHWQMKSVETATDEIDFRANESHYFNEGEASDIASSIPFMVNFSSWFDDANSDPSDFGSTTNAEYVPGPFHVMCGLIGVYVDTTTVDDTETGTQEWGLEVTVDVESWSPIMDKSVRNYLKKGGE